MPSNYESKVTANVDSEIYNKVAEHFHYGQRAIFFRKLFEALVELIKNDKWNEVTDFMYNESDLTLPSQKD